MKQVTRLFVRALLAGFTCFGVSGITLAQDKAKDAKVAPAAKAQEAKSTRKVLAENDKMIVFEITQKPGEVNTPSTTTTRAVRALQGGTTLRTFADGKTETKEWKTGEVQIQVPGPAYTTKNVGKPISWSTSSQLRKQRNRLLQKNRNFTLQITPLRRGFCLPRSKRATAPEFP